MCSKTVPESVAACAFGNPGQLDGEFDCVLQVLFGNMVATQFTRAGVFREVGGWKNILPRPGAAGVAVFAVEREGQINSATAVCEIALVQCTHVREMQL